jgi:DNA polymerase III epsilon subunit-like protein
MSENKSCVLDIETTGLEPWNERVVCIGVRGVMDSDKTEVFFCEDEKQLLERFLAFFRRGGFTEIIGYNLNFDVRFIFGRCLVHEISAPYFFNCAFTDTMDNVRAVRKMYSYNKPGKLDDWLQCIFGIGKLEKGDAIKDMFERRKFTRIINYNKNDVEMTFRLWKRIGFVLCGK